MPWVKFLNNLLIPFNIKIIKRAYYDEFKQTISPQLDSIQYRGVLDKFIELINDLDQKIGKLHQESVRAKIALYWRLVDQLELQEPVKHEMRCELCGFIAPKIYFKEYYSNCMFGGGRLKRYQCPECDVIFGPGKMLKLTPEELSQEYNIHYSAYQEGESKDREIRAFHSLQPRKDGVYLNYGSGSWSGTVPALRQNGWNILAYEPHISAATSDWCISDASLFEGMKFDGIFTNNVLEHFRDPISELRKLSGYLKPGGRMAHATPCYEYLYEFTRFHLFFFVGRSRKYLIENSGLKEESFDLDGDFMNMILSKDDT